MYFCYTFTVVVVEFVETRVFYQGTEFENIRDTCEEGFTKHLGVPIPKRDFIYV